MHQDQAGRGDAATGDASPWLIVDTECALLYRSAVIDWTGQANGYVVELSEDREQWFKPERGRRMRYLRLRFAHGGDLMVREVCVNGVAAP